MPKYGPKAYEQLERMMTEYELTERKPDEFDTTVLNRRKSVKNSASALKEPATKGRIKKSKSQDLGVGLQPK